MSTPTGIPFGVRMILLVANIVGQIWLWAFVIHSTIRAVGWDAWYTPAVSLSIGVIFFVSTIAITLWTVNKI